MIFPYSWSPGLMGLITALLGVMSVGAFAADTANYDTAWSFAYDGGLTANNKVIADNFRDIKVLANGDAICVGETRNSSFFQSVLLVKLSASGNLLEKKMYSFNHGTGASAILIAKNGDIVVGGYRSTSPLLIRLDNSLAIKSTTWYYDSIPDRLLLSRGATINSLIESASGNIIAAAGDHFPDNRGQALNDFAAFLEIEPDGGVKRVQEWLNVTGYDVAGWSITDGGGGRYLLGGNQAVFALDSAGKSVSQNQYTFSLPGVGTVTNNVTRVKRLRSGTLMVAGQSYEEDCWTRYQRLSYDAWWSPLSGFGRADFRYVAGLSGTHDAVFDFAQLVDGRIAFVGRRSNADEGGGVWAFVTDSSGKAILWERQFYVPFKTANGRAATSYVVAATPDSGFTVVGPHFLPDTLGGSNAFALHFVPKPAPSGVRMAAGGKVHASGANGTLAFAFDPRRGSDAELLLYTVQGRFVGRFLPNREDAARGEIRVEPGRLRRGAYLWRFKADREWSHGLAAVAD